MLKLSTKGLYGMKALYELANNYGGPPMSIREISEHHGLPMPFLEQVLNGLKHKGIVISKRGVNGGYLLSRPPEEITIGDVVRALEGPIALCGCHQKETSINVDKRMSQCVTSDIYKRLGDMVENAFDSINLADLAKEEMDITSVGTCRE